MADPHDHYLESGTKVQLKTSDNHEVGVVVYCWLDRELDAFDCYVAFFGTNFPEGKPDAAPYILRYSSLSLAKIDE